MKLVPIKKMVLLLKAHAPYLSKLAMVSEYEQRLASHTLLLFLHDVCRISPAASSAVRSTRFPSAVLEELLDARRTAGAPRTLQPPAVNLEGFGESPI